MASGGDHRLRPEGHALLPDAPVARQRPDGCPVPRARQRSPTASARPLLGDGMARRRPYPRRDLHQHRRPSARLRAGHPADRSGPRPPAAKVVLAPEASPRDMAAFGERFGVDRAQRLRLERGRHRAGARRASPGRSAVRLPALTSRSSTSPASECERATFDSDGRLRNSDRAIGELVRRNAGGAFEGYWNNPEAEAGPVARRLVLVGRPGLPRRRRRLLVRGSGRGLVAGGLRELRGRPHRAHPRPDSTTPLRHRRGRGARSAGG